MARVRGCSSECPLRSPRSEVSNFQDEHREAPMVNFRAANTRLLPAQ